MIGTGQAMETLSDTGGRPLVDASAPPVTECLDAEVVASEARFELGEDPYGGWTLLDACVQIDARGARIVPLPRGHFEPWHRGEA